MFRISAPLFAILFVSGCGGLTTAPVSGEITLDGEPLANASVTFTPASERGVAPSSAGRTGADGRYSLRVVMTDDNGAVLGKHTVIVALIPDERAAEDDAIDPLATSPELLNYDFEFEVESGGHDDANFNLISR